MKESRFDTMQRLLLAALDLPVDQRVEYLDTECGGDRELRDEVLSLIEVEKGDAKSINTSAVAAALQDGTSAVGTTIGPYCLQSLLGSGGMGEVYLAQQKEPIRRKVALKLIKLGMDTREVVSRFASERQSLAVLKHPHIAGVFDAGTSDQGRPYFVMEYVDGVSLTEYADREQLDLRSRIELIVDVCRGIQHAHQRGIIHRDIKPSNILVEIQEGRAIPKIIDFGVAKATNHQALQQTLHTQLGQMVGTPDYMSPEQAGLDDVDTRTDVYSLGVVLFELLVGERPFQRTTGSAIDLDRMRREIRETDPLRPTQAVSKLKAESLERVARARSTTMAQMQKLLQGDLEWIVLKAMEKDRERRYDSASELAADLQRHLDDLPVTASPPSRSYVLGKFVRRNRGLVGAVAIVTAVLVFGIVGTTWQAIRVGFQRDRALKAETNAATNLETAEQVSDFMVSLFQITAPSESRGNAVTAREVLDRGAEAIKTDLAGQPRVQASLLETMGEAYFGLGLYDTALPLVEANLEKCLSIFGEGTREVADARHRLGMVQLAMDDYALAARTLESSVASYQDLGLDQTPGYADALRSLALVHFYRSEYTVAESLLVPALAVYRTAYGETHAKVAAALERLAECSRVAGHHDQAERLYLQAEQINLQVLPPFHPDLASLYNNMAANYFQDERYDESLRFYEQAIEIGEKIYGKHHKNLATQHNNLGMLLSDIGRDDEALEHFARALEGYEQSLGENHSWLSYPLGGMAQVYNKQGRFDLAEAALLRALRVREASEAREHVGLATTLLKLGVTYLKTGRLEESEKVIRRGVAIRKKGYGVEHQQYAVALQVLAKTVQLQGDLIEAEDLFARSIVILGNVHGMDDKRLIKGLTAQAELLSFLGRDAEAAKVVARLTQLQTLAGC